MSVLQKQTGETRMRSYISPLGAWALSFGCVVGWGAFMMPGNSFLPVAGPLGTFLGIAIGAVVLLLVAVNYQYLLKHCPEAGGVFSYVRDVFDHDHGFVAAWFLLLTYIAIVWANATALPLIGRFLLGDIFQFGFSYQIAGFSVYFGELLLSICAIVLGGLLCCRSRSAVLLQSLLALLMCVGIALCFSSVFVGRGISLSALRPGFAPGRSKFVGVFTILAMSPWAFVGYESISHSAEEFSFPLKKALPIMAVSLLTGAAAYILLALVAASTLPEGFSDWPSYIAALGSLDTYEGAPVFFAVREALGPYGVPVLVVTVLSAVLTGLVGNTIAASRLIYALAKEGMMPPACAKLDRSGAPRNAIFLIIAVSVFIPFLGRTATGWIVDVTTVSAAIAYAYASASALKVARRAGDKTVVFTGTVGLGISLIFLLYYLVPNLLAVTAMGKESYLILALWSLIGLILFRFLLLQDKTRYMGRSTIVWFVMLSLIFFASLVWMRETSILTAHQSIEEVHDYYDKLDDNHGQLSEEEVEQAHAFLASEKSRLSGELTKNSLIQIGFMVLSMMTLFNIYAIIHKREKQIEREKIFAEESSRAKTSFLSNMSHEIRTPMNAIIGLDNIALKEPNLPPRTREQLEKIGASAQHLLGLINDILDMSRIESGRMTLKEEEFSIRSILDQINVIINGQCADKGLNYECKIIGKLSDFYIGDDLKLKQVIINILGNAVKFTNAPGHVTLTAEQIAEFDGHCTLRFQMIDTGIGMSKEYIPKIFDAFSQENAAASNRYGSTGLGMAITKNLVNMMNGEIEVKSEKGVGTTFTVTVTLKSSDRSHIGESDDALPPDLRVLVVDDDEVALEHAQLVLRDLGIKADCSASTADGLALIRAKLSEGKPYQFVLSDLRMPDMDGITLCREIHKLDGGKSSVIILTGYNWDGVQEEAASAGVDGLLAKPLYTDSILHELQSLLHRKGGASAEAAAPAEDTGTESLEGLHVLMAEDIDLNAEILSDLLEMEGISADRAENGQKAVELFSQHEAGYYCAILMDVRMPVLDGLGAAKAIRELPRPDAKTIPIIAMTANAFDEDVQRSLQVGMNAHLSKPVEPEHLYQTLEELIWEADEAGKTEV